MTTENAVLGSAEGSPQNQSVGVTDVYDPSVAGPGQETEETVSPEEVAKLRKRAADLERQRSEALSKADKNANRAREAEERAKHLETDVLSKLAEAQTAQLNKAEDPEKAMKELRKLAESAVNDGNVDGLIGIFQEVARSNDAYVDRQTEALRQEREALKQELSAQVAEVKRSLADASPEYLAHKDAVDELMKMGVTDRAVAIAIVKKNNPAASQDARPDLPGGSESTAVPAVESKGITAADVPALSKALGLPDDRPLTKAEIQYLNKGGK
jgi:hypothetical protein